MQIYTPQFCVLTGGFISQFMVNRYVTFSVAPSPKKITSRGTHRPPRGSWEKNMLVLGCVTSWWLSHIQLDDSWPESIHSNSPLLRPSIKQSIQSLPKSYWPQGCLGRQPRKEHNHPRGGLSVYKKDVVTGHKQHKPLSPPAALGQFLLAPWLPHCG